MNYLNKISLLFRKVIYISCGVFDNIVGNKNPVVILCYHSISSDGWRFSTSHENLEEQMKLMLKTHKPVTLEQIGEYLSGKRKFIKPVFAVTFDDGYKNVFCSREMFRKLGIFPTIFVLSNRNNPNRSSLRTKQELLTLGEIKRLKRLGWGVGSHSATHKVLTECSARELVNEIYGSKKKLEKDLSTRIDYFSYPKGRYSESVVDYVRKAGYKMAISMDDGETVASRIFTIPRVGVDGSHGFSEFRYVFSPSVVRFRNLVKKTYLNKYL